MNYRIHRPQHEWTDIGGVCSFRIIECVLWVIGSKGGGEVVLATFAPGQWLFFEVLQ